MGVRFSRFRRRSKWVGLAIVATIVVLDIASVWLTTGIMTAPGSKGPGYGVVRVGWGRLSLYWERDFALWPLTIDPPQFHTMDFKWDFERENSLLTTFTLVRVPLWFLAVVAAVPTAWLWWADRKGHPATQCGKCGYDLRGIAPDAVCPECGCQPVKGLHGSP